MGREKRKFNELASHGSSWTNAQVKTRKVDSFPRKFSHRISFSAAELKRLTDLLTKRFYDQNSQVFSTFLEILPDFVVAYKRDLNDWLCILLTRLLIRMGAPDLLDSAYKKLRICLSVVNSSFDVNAQFSVLIRFVNDNSSAPNVKAKEMILRYLQQVVQHLEPVDLTNNNETRLALSKIMVWANEPKSFDVRKVKKTVFFKVDRFKMILFRFSERPRTELSSR